MKIGTILLLSLLVPQVLMGVITTQENTPAYSSSSSETQSKAFVTSGAPISIERVDWFPDVQYPVDDYTNTTSGFGHRSIDGCSRCSEFHRGLDFTPGVGSPVYAVMDGVVSHVDQSGQYGVHVIITHNFYPDNPYTTVYAHLQVSNITNSLQLDNNIKKGDLIGYVGKTGLATGPHLHFEVRENGRHLNPAAFFKEHIRN
jgi:murein DD-endopeptidase MepM/ murein hydrolase activator NlpD